MFRAKQLTAIALCFVLVGCSGYKRYHRSDFVVWPPSSESESTPFEVGSSIILRTTDGVETRGEVDSIGEASIVVEGQSVPYSRIELVQVRSFLWVPTAALVFTAAATTLVFTVPQGEFVADTSSK